MYNRILVPTDGSEHTEQAVDHAIDLAQKYDAAIHALYVINTGALPSLEPGFREEYIAVGEEIGDDSVGAIASKGSAAGIDVTTSVIRGVPYEEILDYTDANDIDLIAMGTHGRTGLRRFLLGSVAERVIRHTPVPVLLVRIPDED